MPKVMQNLVVLMEPNEHAFDTPLKAGNMILNRFCIDEDAAFELSGVKYLKQTSSGLKYGNSIDLKVKRIEKGKEYSFLRSYFVFRNLIFIKN